MKYFFARTDSRNIFPIYGANSKEEAEGFLLEGQELVMSDHEFLFKHSESGDIATEEEWLNDFNSMDPESWFGVEDENITEDMLEDPIGSSLYHESHGSDVGLIEVEFNADSEAWEEA